LRLRDGRRNAESEGSVILKVRQLKPGQQFMLKRTGEWFFFVEKEIGTPFGVRYIVAYDDPYNLKKRNGRITTLHHSCHVIINHKGENNVTDHANGN
jgi:hypothetical protein